MIILGTKIFPNFLTSKSPANRGYFELKKEDKN